MDAPTATVIAAGIAGTIALVTTAVAYFNMRRQFEITQLESDKNRAHQRALALAERVDNAAADLWVALYKLQKDRTLSTDLEVQIVKGMMWVPNDLRAPLAELLLKSAGNDETACKAAIQTSQEKLLALIRSAK